MGNIKDLLEAGIFVKQKLGGTFGRSKARTMDVLIGTYFELERTSAEALFDRMTSKDAKRKKVASRIINCVEKRKKEVLHLIEIVAKANY